MLAERDLSSAFAPHWALYPQSYVAYPAPRSFLDQIDGNVDKAAWKEAKWSETFNDIQGSDAPIDVYTPALTQFKALYDENYLYIAAILHPSPYFGTQAHYTERNSPIYQRDSDFEVFVDVDNSCHYYKELEINALNTVWNLMLDKPYNDGGVEHSGRVHAKGDPLYYDVAQQITATRVVHGKLNTKLGASWTVEMALSFDDLFANTTRTNQPTVGEFWRVNFSRVELEGKVNWTWQCQRVWDAKYRKFVGQINMHLPDAWGYLVFGNNNDTINNLPRDDWWPAKLAAMHIYYAQQEYRSLHGLYAETLDAFLEYMDAAIVDPLFIRLEVLPNGSAFDCSVSYHPNDIHSVQITHDRHMAVVLSALLRDNASAALA